MTDLHACVSFELHVELEVMERVCALLQEEGVGYHPHAQGAHKHQAVLIVYAGGNSCLERLKSLRGVELKPLKPH